MSTIYLRFPDRAAFLAVMPADFEQQGETGYPLPEGIEAIHICGSGSGRVIKTHATYAPDGETMLTPPIERPGFHVNALGAIPQSWEQYRVAPATPSVTFDGPR